MGGRKPHKECPSRDNEASEESSNELVPICQANKRIPGRACGNIEDVCHDSEEELKTRAGVAGETRNVAHKNMMWGRAGN